MSFPMMVTGWSRDIDLWKCTTISFVLEMFRQFLGVQSLKAFVKSLYSPLTPSLIHTTIAVIRVFLNVAGLRSVFKICCVHCEQEWSQNSLLRSPSVSHHHPRDAFSQSNKLWSCYKASFRHGTWNIAGLLNPLKWLPSVIQAPFRHELLFCLCSSQPHSGRPTTVPESAVFDSSSKHVVFFIHSRLVNTPSDL